MRSSIAPRYAFGLLLGCLAVSSAALGQAPHAEDHASHHDSAVAAAGVPDECAGQADALDSDRRFVVLAARRNVFYDSSGPSLVTLIRVDGGTGETLSGAVGVYPDENGRAVFGAVPPAVYDVYARSQPDSKDAVTLRLEVTPAEYERVLAVMRTWDRRVRERALLYSDDILMNHILFLKQATEALNRCSEKIDLYRLDWGVADTLSDDHRTSMIPFLFFEELRARNESLHVRDADVAEEAPRLTSSSAADAR